MTLVLAFMAALGVGIAFWGWASRGAPDTGAMVQERLQAYAASGRPLTEDEIELQKPFSERFIRPTIERFGKALAERTSEKQRQDLQNRINLAGRPGNLGPSEFMAIRYVGAVV